MTETKEGLVVEEHLGLASKWWSVRGKHCEITIESRPAYCDRGRFIAKLHVHNARELFIDAHDGWPRYYFNWDRMLAELEAWLQKRGELE